MLLVGGGGSAWAVNYSLDFESDNGDYVELANESSFDFSGSSMSTSMWIKAESFASGWTGVVTKGDSAWRMQLNNNSGTVTANFAATSALDGITTQAVDSADASPAAITLSTGQWYHLAGVINVDAGVRKIRVYVNGVETEAGTSATINTNNIAVTIAENLGTGTALERHFDGIIDEVAIWGEALTADEITALYNSGVPISAASNSGNYSSSTGLVSYFTMNSNSGTGSTLTDDSTNSNTGTITGATWSSDAPDTTSPTLSSSTPIDNSTGVGLNDNIVLTFSEAVDAESGNIVIKDSGGSVFETIDVTSGQVTGSGTTTITVNPSSALSAATDYYVTIDATAFDDASSNSYAGISSATTLNFTTASTIVCSGAETITTASSIRYDASAGTCTISDTTTTLTGDDDITFTVPGTGSTLNVYFGTGSSSNQTDHTGCQLGSTTISSGATCRKTDTGQNSNWQSTVNRTNAGGYDVVLSATLATVGNPISSYDITAASIEIGSTAPTVVSVSSDTAAGNYSAGDVIDIDVTFSEVVTVSGTPQITLETGSTDQVVDYASGSGTAILTFSYTVQSGDTSSDLDYTSTSALALNGGTIQDADSNNATLTLASPGASGSLAANEALVIDNAVPTITGTTVASDNSTIDVTFSEAVYNATGGSGALETSDFSLSLSGGTATLSSATPSSISISSNVYTLGLSLSGSADGNETITVEPSSSTAIYDGADNAASTSQSNNTVSLNSGALPSPLEKADVVSSVKAWTNAASRWAGDNLDIITKRLTWLERHKDTTQTSHQGIKLHFENEVINAVMNTTPESKQAIVGKINQHLDPTQKAIALLENTEAALVASGEAVASDAQLIAVNEAARLREDLIGSLNPSFGTVVDDWSVWSAGEITIGKTDATYSASEQDLDAQTISLGFDKPMDNNGLMGVVLSIGQSNTDIGSSTTNVKSDNYALSSYRVFKQDSNTTIETVAGLGHLKFDTLRKDGSDTLAGKRNANQVFASATLRDETIERNDWSISPYGRASLAYTRLDKFSETGAATALTYHKQTLKETKLYVGADMNYLITINNGTIKPFVNLEYSADLSDGSNATMNYNTEDTSYTLNLDRKATSNWKLGLGADLYTEDEWDSSISYERTEAVNAGYSDSLAIKIGLKF